MAHLDPLPLDQLPQYAESFAAYQAMIGFVPNAFPTMARRPAMLDALQGLLREVFAGTVPRSTKSFVALMSSYGSGCRYCQAHQATSLAHMGVSSEKLAALHEYERSSLFDDAERAAMRLAFAAGQQPNAVTAAHFDDLKRHYDEGEIVEIVGVIGAFGFLNRWHETVATDLEDEPLGLATEVLAGIGWDPGRHAPAS